MKSVRASVRGQTVRLDFSGFVGDACVVEREEIRRALEAVGIRAAVKNRKPKAEARARGGQRGGIRSGQ